jgi:hypothetical protein
MTVSESGQWLIVGSLIAVILIASILWIRYMPSYRAYRLKCAKLNSINVEYEELRRRRKDLVFHFYWSVDSGQQKDADKHETEVIAIDRKLESLRDAYTSIQRGG